MLRVTEEMSQLHKKAIGRMSQPKDSDVLAPALRATGAHGVFGARLCGFEPSGRSNHVRHFGHNLSSASSAEPISSASFEVGSIPSSVAMSAT